MKKQLITLHEFVVQVYEMTDSEFFAEYGIDNTNNCIPIGERKLKVIHDYAMFLQQPVSWYSFDSTNPLFNVIDFEYGSEGISFQSEKESKRITLSNMGIDSWIVSDFIGFITYYNQY